MSSAQRKSAAGAHPSSLGDQQKEAVAPQARPREAIAKEMPLLCTRFCLLAYDPPTVGLNPLPFPNLSCHIPCAALFGGIKVCPLNSCTLDSRLHLKDSGVL